MEQKNFPQRAAGRFVSAVVRVLRQGRRASRGNGEHGHAHAHACSIVFVSVIICVVAELSC